MTLLQGKYFYPGQARSHIVKVNVHEKFLDISFGSQIDSFELDQCSIEAIMPNCPVVVILPDGGRLEFQEKDLSSKDLEKLLTKKALFLSWLEGNVPTVSICLFLSLGFFYAFFEYGAPSVSSAMAKSIPGSWAAKLDRPLLSALERDYLSPTELPLDKREELIRHFQKFTNTKVSITFRKGRKIGPNAFALSGKTVVFTDELVELLKNKDLLLAIYFHEVGHLENRHLLSYLGSALLLNAIGFIIVGDLPGLTESIANITLTLASLKHSRDYEKEADSFCVQQLKKYNLSADNFVQALTKIAQANGVSATKEPNSISSTYLDYLSTHPDLAERIKLIKEGYKE